MRITRSSKEKKISSVGTEFQLHKSQLNIFTGLQKKIIDFTEHKLLNSASEISDVDQKKVIFDLLEKYKRGQVAISWRDGKPCWLNVTKDSLRVQVEQIVYNLVMQNEIEVPSTTKVLFKNDARRKLYEGIEIAAEAVGCTLGPRGKTVLIQRKEESPVVTKDGVTVSKSINLKDPVKRMGAALVREAATQTNEIAGDGTTTSTVLTHSMVKEGLKLLEAGYSSKELCEGINNAIKQIDNLLVNSSKKLTTSEEIAQIGTISANGDRKIGELIASAMEKVGRDGIITVEDAKGTDTLLEVVEGMQFERGYLSPYFVTNQERMNVSYDNVRVLVTDRKISVLKELIPVLEKLVQARQSLLIIADDLEGEALQGLVLNRVNANLQVVAVKSPGYGKYKDDILSDICVLTGTKLVSPSTGLKLETLTLNDLGTLKKVVVDSKTTTMVGNSNLKQHVEDYVQNLRSQLQDVTMSVDELVKLRTRIAKLSSGVAIIKVGGATEVEMIERKYRIEDALNATKAAAEEGIVAGGGMALMNIANSLQKEFESSHSREISAGASIVFKSCYAPIRKIIENSGVVPDVIFKELERNVGLGYNAATGEFVDVISCGVIDPCKVTRTAIKNAASVAVTFLSLDALIVEEEQDHVK